MSPPTQKKTILIVAGETSGDMHGASLMRALNAIQPDIQFIGIGGDRMIAEGLGIIHHAREMAFLGFFEVIQHLPFVRRVFKEMLSVLAKNSPDCVILIDYPGFNLRFAKKAKKQGFKIVYYISPQVWAWGRNRIKKIAHDVDRMLVIFPFEEEIYQKVGMDVHFVGHPLKDIIQIRQSREAFLKEYQLDPNQPVVGLLPGSRKQEIHRLLPEMIRACDQLNQTLPIQIILGVAPMLSEDVYQIYLKGKNSIVLVKNQPYHVMAYADVALVASGTATLETALIGTPMIVLYKMAPLSYLIGKLLVKVPYIGLVNIVAGKKIVPELIQSKVRANQIVHLLHPLLIDREKREEMKTQLNAVSVRLGDRGASERAANTVLELI